MKAVHMKLKSNEGASLMLALLFFVMCATVSAVILTAATVSSGRISNLAKNDQKRETMTSAAGVIAKSFVNGDGIRITKVTVDRDGEELGSPEYHYYKATKDEISSGLTTTDNLTFQHLGSEIVKPNTDLEAETTSPLLLSGVYRFFSDEYGGDQKTQDLKRNLRLDPEEPASLRDSGTVPLTSGMQFRMHPNGDLQIILFGACTEAEANAEFSKATAFQRGSLNPDFQYLSIEGKAKSESSTYYYIEEEEETETIDGVETKIIHTITTTTEIQTISWDQYEIHKFYGDEG